MKREEKRKIIDEIEENLKKLKEQSVFFVDFKSIKGNDITNLRKDFKLSGIYYRVVKNDLLRIACKELSIEVPHNIFVGNVALVVSSMDPTELAKKFVEAKDADEKPFFEMKGGFVDGKYLTGPELVELSKLPPKPVIIGKLLYLLNSPIQRLVTVLSKPERDLVTVLNQIKDKKESIAA
ncbi:MULTISPECIES: 50S ribosomal protein L10 [Caldisericum]|jgi:large subunit ribosomal protein L10|uniref:Large ribosomal subunit protein uL10 n=1 Tax=Caldisericum exile TaxID=693075 RepID=A0A2J6WEZ7_9BACT|nr:MAG: 50S ribosomal protein L10 [Caldisericum exile]